MSSGALLVERPTLLIWHRLSGVPCPGGTTDGSRWETRRTDAPTGIMIDRSPRPEGPHELSSGGGKQRQEKPRIKPGPGGATDNGEPWFHAHPPGFASRRFRTGFRMIVMGPRLNSFVCARRLKLVADSTAVWHAQEPRSAAVGKSPSRSGWQAQTLWQIMKRVRE